MLGDQVRSEGASTADVKRNYSIFYLAVSLCDSRVLS
jgi:hypothetical protein